MTPSLRGSVFVFLFAIVFGCPLLAACAAGGAPAVSPVEDSGRLERIRPGQLMDASGARVAPESFISSASGARYVLVGEEHGNFCNHRMQAELLAAMAEAGLQPVLGLEQVAYDRQPVLDRFAAGELSIEELPEALDWTETWGHNFDAYESLFLTAKRYKLPVVALNAPREVVRQVSRGGLEALSPEDRARLPVTVPLPSDDQRAALKSFFDGHKQFTGRDEEAGDDDAFASFLLVQSLWDSVMAERAIQASEALNRPVLIAAGSGHVEWGWGIARRIQAFRPGAKSLIVLPARNMKAPVQGKADLWYYCPVAEGTGQGRIGVNLEEPAPGAKVQGLTVRSVVPGSRAEAAGIKAGDVLVKAGGRPLPAIAALREVTREAAREGRPLVLEVKRGKKTLTVEIPAL